MLDLHSGVDRYLVGDHIYVLHCLQSNSHSGIARVRLAQQDQGKLALLLKPCGCPCC